MSNIKLLGTGCPSPSYKRFGPSTLIQIGKKNYLFDAGSGVSQRLNQSNIKSSEVEALFITHMHSDHIIDIYQLYISGWHQGRIEPFKIIAIVSKIINEVKLKIKLKLFFMNTPIIKIENIDNVKKISGSNIFKLFIILI